MSVRDKFVELFGEEQTAAIERAANEHGGGCCRPPRGKGSDVFRWCLVIAIAYECMSKDGYREHHGITTPWEELRAAIKAHGDLAHHDGDIDYLALFAGTYNEFMPAAPAESTEVA